ncbi:hypothetical protein ACQPZX_14935 [Actinoplanes sp. CA-142083]|uniref:hypothetical protein n=1 Tax=Actinoplanes sp. CA-142083 TaxID=3239903 RepID=UPI003D9301E9
MLARIMRSVATDPRSGVLYLLAATALLAWLAAAALRSRRIKTRRHLTLRGATSRCELRDVLHLGSHM